VNADNAVNAGHVSSRYGLRMLWGSRELRPLPIRSAPIRFRRGLASRRRTVVLLVSCSRNKHAFRPAAALLVGYVSI